MAELTLGASTHPSRASLIQMIAEPVILATGWRRRAIAIVAGAVGALALAPVNCWPAMLAPMMAAVWLIDGSAETNARGATFVPSIRSAFWVGWWWGFGYFVAGLWWLGAAFLVDANAFAWALPIGVLALPAGLAFFSALGFALARALWSAGPARILALTVGLGLAEWLRALVLTGFPWNELGMALGGTLVLAQAASWVGLHGLTLAAIAIFAAPATLIDDGRGRLAAAPTVIGLILLVLLAGFGAWRLSAPDAAIVSGVKLRIMQPNTGQGADFSPENKDAIMRRYLDISDRSTSPTTTGVADVTHLIWPESAFPFLLAHDPIALGEIADLLHGGATLITGAARADRAPSDSRPHYFNSIQVVDRRGAFLDHYDKAHLVPFGEYLPFRGFFERMGLSQLVRYVPGGFDAGVGRKLLQTPGLPDAWPMVCYEAIFPDELGSFFGGGRGRAGFILNLTDDIWFGRTAGPYQHFVQARLRSVEQGLPMVRAGNSGISAVLDGFGRTIAELPLGIDGALDASLPVATKPTVYSRYGALAPAAIWLICVIFSLALRDRARRRG
jgi:apolipoprotein N-acyltransferase